VPRREKFAKPAKAIVAERKARQIISAPDFDDPVEWTWWELWHHEGRRARHGAAMQGPDYTWWHGMHEVGKPASRAAPCKNAVSCLARTLRRVRAPPPNRPSAREIPCARRGACRRARAGASSSSAVANDPMGVGTGQPSPAPTVDDAGIS
jgi:hypothetical protein